METYHFNFTMKKNAGNFIYRFIFGLLNGLCNQVEWGTVYVEKEIDREEGI